MNVRRYKPRGQWVPGDPPDGVLGTAEEGRNLTMEKKTRRRISFPERISSLTKRIEAAERKLESLRLARQAFIEGHKLKAEKELQEIEDAIR